MFLQTLRTQFEHQRLVVVHNIGRQTLTKGYSRKEKQDWLGSFADWQILTSQLAAELSPLMAAVVLETARQALIDLGADPADFDQGAAEVADYPDDRSLKVAVAINDETQKQLRATLSQGADEGAADAEMLARVEAVFGAALTYRAARTTSTEIVNAQSFGDIAAWKQSGLVEAKEWYTAEDELVCPFCASLDGAIMPLDDTFFQQGDTIHAGGETLKVGFGDIHGTPLHVSCRCYLMAVLIKPI